MKPFAIKRLARLGRDPCALLIVGLAGLGTAHILARTASYGAAVTHDSSFLLSTAINFLAGEGWRTFTGYPLVAWPPLFPLLLAAGGWVGIEPLTAGRLINATAFGLTILAAGGWLRSNLRLQWLGLVATASLTVSLPLSELASHFLTDSLFVLLTLLALIQLAAFLNRGGRTLLLGAAVCIALAALTRYPGVILIGTGVLLLLGRRTPPLAARLKDASVFGAVSSVPLAGVLTHNWAVTGTLTGYRSGSGQSLSDVLSQVADVFRAWVMPPNAPDGVGYLLWTAAGLVVAAGAVVVVSGLGLERRGKDRTASPLLGLGPVIPFGGFALAYLSFIVAIVPLVIHSQIPPRYLLPVYMPLLLAAVFLLDRFLSIETAGRRAAAKWGLASLVLLGTLAHGGFSAHRNLTITDEARVAGFESWTQNGSYWESSETLKYVRTKLSDGRVYSNGFTLLWFWDRTAAPGKHQKVPAALHNVTSDIMQQTDGGSPYIAWLRSESEKSFYDFDAFDIRCLDGVEPVAELADGVVFRVTAAEPFAANRHRACKQRYLAQLIQQAQAGGERVVSTGWSVYRNELTLTYHKQPCAPADTQAKFTLEIFSDDPADLPADRQPYGFTWTDFHFHRRGGIRVDDQCVMSIQLPAYAIGRRVRVGQWSPSDGRTLWEAEFSGADKQRYVEQLIQQASQQVERAGWTVYRTGRKLTYVKQPCTAADVQAKFVLHVVPADPADLPADRRQYDSDNLDFYFDQFGFRLDDQCTVVAPLPDYAISRIHIGQWIAKENRTLWEAELSGAGD